MPAQRSHNPNKISLRKSCRGLLLGPLAKRLKPSRAELQKVEKEKKRKSLPQASTSSPSSAAKASTSSRAKRFAAVATNTDLLLEAPDPPLGINVESPRAQDQTLIATTQSNIDKFNSIAVNPECQNQAQNLYTFDYNTLATSFPYSAPSLLPTSEENSQCTAPSFASSIIQASDFEPDINDSFLLPEPTQTFSWTELCAPSIQSPLVPEFTQDFGNPYDLTWASNMGTSQPAQHNITQDVQQGPPPSAPNISSSSSAGQELNLVKATYDGGYSTRQVVEFDGRSDLNFIAQSSVDILQRSSSIQVISVPPGIGRKTQCPNGALVNIERVLYAWIEFESPHLPFPPTRVYFVVYDGFGGEDGIHMTLGHDWTTRIK